MQDSHNTLHQHNLLNESIRQAHIPCLRRGNLKLSSLQERREGISDTSFVMSRVLTKTEYDTYNPTLNQYLGDQRIRRKDAPALNDQKDTIAFEWMSVDL